MKEFINSSSNKENTNTWRKANGMKDELDRTRLLGSKKIHGKTAASHKLLILEEPGICPFEMVWLSFFGSYERSGRVVWESDDPYLFDSGHFIVCWKKHELSYWKYEQIFHMGIESGCMYCGGYNRVTRSYVSLK